MVLLTASVTDSLVTFATHVIRDLGLAGVWLMTLTSSVISLPGTEPTMLLAGFNVYQGHLSLPGIIVLGVIGDVLGAAIAYAIGYYGRVGLFERHGAKFHMSASRFEIAHRWFERFGSPAVLVSRCIPLIRAVFPYAAGVSRMPFGRFIAFAFIGSVIWIGGLGILGREVGASWQSWRHNLEYVDYVAAALIVALIAWLVVRRVRASRSTATDVA